jgi:hypothetical protein
VIDESERITKVVVMTYRKELSRRLLGGTEENHKNLQSR